MSETSKSRTFTPDQKVEIVLAGLPGDRPRAPKVAWMLVASDRRRRSIRRPVRTSGQRQGHTQAVWRECLAGR